MAHHPSKRESAPRERMCWNVHAVGGWQGLAEEGAREGLHFPKDTGASTDWGGGVDCRPPQKDLGLKPVHPCPTACLPSAAPQPHPHQEPPNRGQAPCLNLPGHGPPSCWCSSPSPSLVSSACPHTPGPDAPPSHTSVSYTEPLSPHLVTRKAHLHGTSGLTLPATPTSRPEPSADPSSRPPSSRPPPAHSGQAPPAQSPPTAAAPRPPAGSLTSPDRWQTGCGPAPACPGSAPALSAEWGQRVTARAGPGPSRPLQRAGRHPCPAPPPRLALSEKKPRTGGADLRSPAPSTQGGLGRAGGGEGGGRGRCLPVARRCAVHTPARALCPAAAAGGARCGSRRPPAAAGCP